MAGQVREVVLENFKSYAGQVRVGPFKKFTCIVGPNGAGKSNLMDAISFVLGVRTRHLRSDRLQDLVHRKEDEDAEVSKKRPCSVELVYSQVGAEGSPEQLIVFRRVIQPSAEARFQIDGASVSQEEYFKRLETIHILSKAKNFLVFQGDVEAAAHRQGKDLTDFFEKVSGSSAFQEEFNKLAAEKAQREDTARDLFTRARNAKNERKRIEKQKEEAEKYRTLEAKRKKKQVEFYLFRLHSADSQAEELQKSLAAMKRERRSAEAEAADLKAKRDVAEQERAQVHVAANEADKALGVTQSELLKMNPQQIQVRSKLEAMQLQLEAMQRTVETDDKRRQLLQAQASAVSERVEMLKSELPELRERAQQELPFTAEQHAQFKRAQEEAERASSAMTQQARELEDQVKSLSQQRATTEQDGREAALRALHLRPKVADLEESEKTASSLWQRQSKLSQAKRMDFEALKSTSQDVGAEKHQLERERGKILKEIQDITATDRQIEQEKRLTQVSKDLAQLVPGVQGRVLNKCSDIARRYRVAMNIAMGGYLDAIVTDTVQGARQCVQHLKDRMLEPLTFLPLDNLRSALPEPQLQEALRGHQALRSALSCVTFDPRLSRAFQFMLGDVVFADSLEEGRRFVFEELRSKGIGCRIVTLDGETISRDGNIAVSSEAARRGSARFDFTELENAKERLEAIDARLYELGSKGSSGDATLVTLEDEVKRMEVRTRESELSLERIRAELQVRRKELQSEERRLSELEPRATSLGKEEATLRERHQNLEAHLGSLVAIHFEELSRAVGVKDVQSMERKFRRDKEAALFRESEVNQQVQSLEAELAMVEQSIQERVARDPAAAAAACQAEIHALDQQDGRLGRQAEALQARLDQLAEALQKQKQKEKDKEQAVTRFRQELKEAQRASAEVERKLASLAAEIRTSADARAELLRQSVLEGVELPITGRGGKAALKKLVAAMAEQSGPASSPAKEALLEEVHVDFTKLPQETREAAIGIPETELRDREEEFRAELRRLESDLELLRPNLKAVEQIEQAEEDANHAEYQAQIAKKRIDDIQKRFEEVRVARRERFNECFRKVQDSIQEVYRRLTKFTLAPGSEGGSAFLDLDDIEDPWNGGVKFTAMPPAKRFCDITLLSGGEKTLAAMALLFAMQAYQRPPFLVLDEIDAYLDHGNVQALASYIAEFDCQTIVISQKDRFFSRGEGLVGVSKSMQTQTSVVFTMDLQRLRELRAPVSLGAPVLAQAGA